MNEESRPKQTEQTLKQKLSEEMVLLNLKDGQYYSLDPVGQRVWELCDGTRRVSEIITVICSEFDAGRERVRDDLLELLGELADAKLVEELP